MEKIIIIDGKQIKFKATGGIGYRYKAQFGREYIADAMELEKFVKQADACKKDADGKPVYDSSKFDFTKFSLEMLYNILWTMAKTADDTIPPPMQWLDSFDAFPVVEIYSQVQDILQNNLSVDRKNA